MSLAAVKAVTAAQLSMASHGVYSVTLDEAIEAMRLTAADMSVKYKETSLSVSAAVNCCTESKPIGFLGLGDIREDSAHCSCVVRHVLPLKHA